MLLAATVGTPPWGEVRAKLETLIDEAKRRGDSLPEVTARLVAAGLRDSASVTVFVGRILCNLSKCAESDDEVLRFEGLPELELNPQRVEGSGDELHELHEIHELHAHFRGSIPFDDLWRDWMINARSRAMWRCEILPCGGTRARRLEDAALAQRKLEKANPGFNEQTLRKQILQILDDLRSGRACPEAVRYLLLLINTRRAFLVRRRHTGLAFFTTAFDRVSKASKRRWQRGDTRARIRDVCRKFEDHGCVSLELRPTLKATRRETQAALRSLVLGYLDYVKDSKKPLAMGLVCSFFKQEGLPDKGVNLGKRDDAGMVEGLDGQQRIWTRQAEALVAILGDVPAIRTFVVGVDAAGRECGSPCRFLAAPYEVIGDYNRRYNLGMRRGRDLDVTELKRRVGKESPDAVWESLNRESPTSKFGSRVRLGFTVHAGEDFVDPLTGLREVWEAVQHLKLECGDRIGHGLVLALRPEELKVWIRRSRQSGSAELELHKPAGVHALDMAWAYGCGISARESELELSRAVVDAVRGLPLFAAVRPALALPVPPVGVPLFGVSFVNPDAPRSCVMTRVVVNSVWEQRFEILRAKVEDFVVRRGIVIESCPSSNCVVAGLKDPPLLSLLKHDSLRVVVATDDPGILEAWPDQELGRLKNPKQRARVLAEAVRSSFVRRIWRIKDVKRPPASTTSTTS